MRISAAADRVHDRQSDGQQQRLQDAHDDDACHGDSGDRDFHPTDAGDSSPRVWLHKPEGGGYDDRAKGCCEGTGWVR